VLSTAEAVAQSQARRGRPNHLVAMYSSYIGGIITDPALMTVWARGG
jgi:hypothetical protein